MSRHEVAEDRRVLVDEVQAGLARLLGRARGDHRDGGAAALLDRTGPDAGGAGERHRVHQVHRLALGPSLVGVRQDDLGGQAGEEQRERERRPDGARADHGDPGRMRRGERVDGAGRRHGATLPDAGQGPRRMRVRIEPNVPGSSAPSMSAPGPWARRPPRVTGPVGAVTPARCRLRALDRDEHQRAPGPVGAGDRLAVLAGAEGQAREPDEAHVGREEVERERAVAGCRRRRACSVGVSPAARATGSRPSSDASRAR